MRATSSADRHPPETLARVTAPSHGPADPHTPPRLRPAHWPDSTAPPRSGAVPGPGSAIPPAWDDAPAEGRPDPAATAACLKEGSCTNPSTVPPVQRADS